MALSFTRLGFLFKLQWAENKKMYLYGLLALIIIMAAVFSVTNERVSSQADVFAIGLLVSGGIFTSTLLSRFSDKTKAVSALMLPVSALEKSIMATVYSMVIFPLLYLLLIYPIVVLVYYYHIAVKGDLCELMDYRYQNFNGLIATLFFLLQAFMLFGSVLFRRFTLVKTVVLGSLILFGVILVNEGITNMFFRDVDPAVLPAGYVARPPDTVTVSNYKRVGTNAAQTAHDSLLSTGTHIIPTRQFDRIASNPFGRLQFVSCNTAKNSVLWNVEMPPALQFCFITLFYMVIPLFLVLTYLRLKEKFLA